MEKSLFFTEPTVSRQDWATLPAQAGFLYGYLENHKHDHVDSFDCSHLYVAGQGTQHSKVVL